MALKIVETFLEVWPQWVAILTVTLLSVSFGLVIGWTSPYLALLIREDSVLHVTEDEASWIASLVPFGRLFGAVVGSIIMEYFGSKMALLVSAVPAMVGWICIIFANSAAWLFVARICGGISLGMFFSCFPMYAGEIASANIRGALVSMIINGMPLGTLIGNILGTQLSMTWFGIISLILSICYIVIFPFLPQSPYYHVRQNDLDQAKRAIRWYRQKSDVGVELEAIENFVRTTKSRSFLEKLKQLSEQRNRRIFCMVLMMFIFMQLSGLNTIIFYMEIIVRKAKVTSLEPASVVILSSGFGIVVGWIGVYLIDRCSRRVLIAVSCSCVIIAMALLGLHFTLLDQHFDPKSLEWMSILAMMLFMMMSIGLIPVPNTMLSELFPDDLRSIAGFAVSITSALFAFICSRTYQPLVDLMSEMYVFWMYALLMTVCLIYSIFTVPETKGKSLQEIQEMLSGNSLQEENVRTA